MILMGKYIHHKWTNDYTYYISGGLMACSCGKYSHWVSGLGGYFYFE